MWLLCMLTKFVVNIPTDVAIAIFILAVVDRYKTKLYAKSKQPGAVK